MEAIVLAGGLGTRLRGVINDVPKPMAPVGKYPFLSYLLDYLWKQDVKKVILSVGYKHEIIQNYYGNLFKDMALIYSIEKELLGTGGAIKQSMELVESMYCFVLNGDSFFDVNLFQMNKTHLENNADITISLKKMYNFDRYGTVEVDNGRIISFKEKKYHESGFINGGIYLINKKVFEQIPTEQKFSIEVDFFQKYSEILKIIPFISNGYFIDIGVPDDYKRAQNELVL
jgi:D-glycero-alpha-D-manno-heptose 1-phosphate guanylyltransferase